MGKVLIIMLLFSLLPIWRIAGSKQGYNIWQILTQGYQKHLGIEEASERATEAYRITHPYS